MATGNFGSTIFSKYYVVETEDPIDFIDDRNEIQNALTALPGCYDDNSGYNIAYIYSNIELCGVPFEMRLDIELKPGYYSGAWFDGRLFLDGMEYDIDDLDPAECAGLLLRGLWDTDRACQYRGGSVTGFAKMQGKNLCAKIEKAYNDLLQQVEAVIAPYTIHCVQVAKFSNGETLYKKVV